MSADRWGICPKCGESKETKMAIAKAQYGKVSQDEYEDGIRSVARLSGEEETLREDFEFFRNGFELGVFYQCECEKCGFVRTFQTTVDLAKDAN